MCLIYRLTRVGFLVLDSKHAPTPRSRFAPGNRPYKRYDIVCLHKLHDDGSRFG